MAHYISNYLNNEASRIKARKLQNTNKSQNQRITRKSTFEPEKQMLKTTKNDNRNRINNVQESATMQTLQPDQAQFSESILFVLRFYGPVNPKGSCRARSVYLTTRLLGRLSPLSG